MSSPLSSGDLYLVHDYLIQMGGAERVVATMARAFPEAPIYTSATDYRRLSADFAPSTIHNSWMQRLPGIHRHFKKYFPFFPHAFASLQLPPRRAAWISASTFAKYIRPARGTTTFAYIHNPTRFLWDSDVYIGGETSNPLLVLLAKSLLKGMRRRDLLAAQRMDHLIANSENVRKRIAQFYHRESTVIHPPVNVDSFAIEPAHQGYYLILSRLIGYKNIDRAVLAFQGWDRELRIVGDGTDRRRLEGLAGPNVRFLGHVSEAELRRQLVGARALIFPGEEDFGIAPVEAQACGKPVIAFAAGGALETVIEGKTGLFFRETSPASLRSALEASEKITWDPQDIRRHAERFSEEAFLRQMLAFMEEKLGQP